MEFIPEGATVNKHRYKEILRRLLNSIRRKRPELSRRKNWLLIHDSDPAHLSVFVQEELEKQQVTVLPHTLHPSDLAPCERKATWASISVGRGDRHCHKGSRAGASCKYLSGHAVA
jgi:hypothetical protein